MSQCYKQVHDGPGCVCVKGWCACVEVSGNKGGLNGKKNNRKAIPSLWMSVTTDCMFTSALSPFYNAGGAQYLFTRSFIKNTSPASREWTSVRAFYSSLHSVTLQDITDLDRAYARQRDYWSHVKPYFTVDVSRCHFSIYRPTSAHEHINMCAHTFLHYHSTHTLYLLHLVKDTGGH